MRKSLIPGGGSDVIADMRIAAGSFLAGFLTGVFFFLLGMFAFDAQAATRSCDLDGNGWVDYLDVAIVQSSIGRFAWGDPADINGDGKVTANDVRACVLQCTRAGCKGLQ